MKTKMIITIQSALANTPFTFTISGVVLFGSQAKDRQKPGSDVDLLVAAENIHPKLHRRKKEIVELKRSLPGLALDVLLLTPAEVVSNFSNHNPLFLSIAEDGIIIEDKDDFLFDLMQKTREYIVFKGIERLRDGWRFPVAYRVATSLSSVSNKDFAAAMLKDGKRDFSIGQNLLRDSFFDKAVYHFQQAAEKSIKSILITLGIFQKTHYIGQILREEVQDKSLPGQWKQKLSEIADLSEELEPEVSLSRYPGIINNKLWIPSEEYDQKDAEESLKKTEAVLCTAVNFFNYWFKTE